MEDYRHQTEAFERAKDASFPDRWGVPQRYYGLLMEQGTGKTRVAIQIAENHHREGRISGVLVITTKGLIRNWSDIELPKHSSEPYSGDVWPNKSVYIDKNGRLYYWMVNIDALITENWVIRMKEFMQIYPDFMVIVDESTLIKTPSAKRTRRTWEIGQLAKARLIMTGLPTPNSPLDLYAQCRFLHPDALGFKDFAQFKFRHAEIIMRTMGQKMFPEIIGYKNLGELKEKLSMFTSIVRKEDCLDLPPITQRIFPVPLTPEQRKPYNELKREMLTYIQGETVEAKNVISMINKGLQICSGQMKLPDGTYLDIPTNRLEALQELVEECPDQTIVWTAFVHNATAIGKQFGKDALLLPSGLTLDQRQTILNRFRSGEGKILVANPASAGHGITLTNCSNVIHYSRSFNFEHRAQADARVHRIGQTKACLVTDLCDPTTLEKRTIDILTSKQQMSDFMLDGNFVRELLGEKLEEYV